MGKRLKVIFNPIAGRGSIDKKLERIVSHFETYNYKVDLLRTTKKGDAGRFAGECNEGVTAVVAVGGDGTINEVINGLRDQDVPVGIIPGGTSNLLAGELGISSSVEKACDIICNGKTYTMDLGFDKERHFSLMAGIGIDAEVVREIDSVRSGNISKLSYVIPIIKTIFSYKYPSISVEVDGKHIVSDAAYVFVSNVKSYIGPVKFTYLAESNDGKFDICIIKGKGRYKIIKYIFGAITRTLLNFSDVIFLRGNEVGVSSDSEVLYQLDGDPGRALPARFILKPEAVKFFVP